ncbi:hypothetical protein CPB86DRAFT_772754 [Serendipita vermifera]|nr:hypothetical protein CPB86DRAFT_772754 [Serendipita vermifera]
MNADSRLPQPGQPQFLRRLRTVVGELLSENAPFDESIFTWILFCLGVGDKHLLLRTVPKDVTHVQKIVKSILFSVFGLNTVTIRARPEYTPEELLFSLFPPSLASPASPQTAPPVAIHTQSHDHRRPHPRQRQNSSSYMRSSSHGHIPNYAERLSHLFPEGFLHNQQHGKEILQGRFRLSAAPTVTATEDDRVSVRALRPVSGRGYIPPDHDLASHSHQQHQQQHSYHPGHSHHQSHSLSHGHFFPNTYSQLPHAVIISGLETTSSAVQDTLLDVIRTRAVVLESEDGTEDGGTIWNLPDGFILICVCPLGDGSSRPGLQSSLLDRFAFHANVLLSFPGTPSEPPKSPLLRRTALLSRDYLESIQRIIRETEINDVLDMYIANLISSIRYHPQLDASLISSRCTKDLHEFTKAAWLFMGNSVEYYDDRNGAGSHERISELDRELLSPSTAGSSSIRHGVKVRRRVMTPEDVKRVIRHVVGHRVSVRESLHDQLLGNLLCSASRKMEMDAELERGGDVEVGDEEGTLSDQRGYYREVRRTIKDVLNEAIAAV